jgi:hypothetical protein
LVSIIEPSLFTPENVACITGLRDTSYHGMIDPTDNVTSVFTFGRHFAASVDRGTLLAFAGEYTPPIFHADNEWELAEGVISWTSILRYLTSLPATSTDRISPQEASDAERVLRQVFTLDPTAHRSRVSEFNPPRRRLCCRQRPVLRL